MFRRITTSSQIQVFKVISFSNLTSVDVTNLFLFYQGVPSLILQETMTSKFTVLEKVTCILYSSVKIYTIFVVCLYFLRDQEILFISLEIKKCLDILKLFSFANLNSVWTQIPSLPEGAFKNKIKSESKRVRL